MKRPTAPPSTPQRVLIFVDESNVTSSAKVSNRKLDWIQLRDFLVGERALLEMVVYAGLPPAMLTVIVTAIVSMVFGVMLIELEVAAGHGPVRTFLKAAFNVARNPLPVSIGLGAGTQMIN